MSLSMLSVRGVNLPMYTTLRRTTAAFTMLAEYALAGKTQPPAVARAVAVTCVGAALAGAADASFRRQRVRPRLRVQRRHRRVPRVHREGGEAHRAERVRAHVV